MDLHCEQIFGSVSKKSIFLSIIIPTYNRPETICEAIDSVLKNQHIEGFDTEIIVVDNSADFSENNNTKKALDKYRNADNFRYYINKHNLGMEGNFNKGVELCNGKFVAFLHDDDLLSEDYLAYIVKCIKSIKNNEEVGFIKTSHASFKSGSELPKLSHEKFLLNRATITEAIITGSGLTSTPTCGIVFSKKAFISVNGFDANYYPISDAIIGCRILNKGFKGFTTASQLGYYRIGLNESMKVETIKTFVAMKVRARNEIYSMKTFGWLFKFLFESTIYCESIESWLNVGNNKFDLNIQISDLDFLKLYKKHPIKKSILKLVRRIYKLALVCR